MKLTRSGLDLHEIALRESLFHVANGYLGVRASLEEGVPAGVRSIRGAYINAFYDTYPIHYAEKLYGFPTEGETIVNIPDVQSVSLFLDGERFDPCTGSLKHYSQTLDMAAGRYIRRVLWVSPQGRETEIKFKRMASFSVKELFTIHITIIPKNWSGTLKVVSTQNSDVYNDGDPNDPRKAPDTKRTLRPVTSRAEKQVLYIQCETLHSRLAVACAVTHTFPPSVTASCHSGETCNTAVLEGNVEQGRPLSLAKWCAFTDSRRHALPLFAAEQLLKAHSQTPIETWYRRQRQIVSDFWNDTRITLRGKPAVQSGVDYAAYTLFQSAGQDGISAIAAKGLSGEGYEGHYFWDTEIYMFPFFLLTRPQMARNLLDYRYATLDGAREQARLLGHRKGALYPWRTISGCENSSYFPSGSAQYHINSDIAYAVCTYYFVTGDLAYMRDKGAEILVETARLWLDIGHWYEGQFRIDGVTGPDEYTCLVNNNYYTNLSAKYHLRHTLLICDRLREAYPAFSPEDQYGLTDAECAEFQKASDRMYLPYNETLGIYAQDDSFLQKSRMDLQSMNKAAFPLLLHFHPLALYRRQVCKQADTVLAHFLYEDGITGADIRRTYAYYEQITTHDSSLSPCVFSMMAARIGDPEKALRYYMHSVQLDLKNMQRNTNDGIHAANMGGSYMGIVFGFAGLRIHPDGLSLRPCIPKTIAGYAFPLQYRGKHIFLQVTQDSVTLQADTPIGLTVYDTLITVTGNPVTLPLKAVLPA